MRAKEGDKLVAKPEPETRRQKVWCLMYYDDEHECEPETVEVFRSKVKAKEALAECRTIPEIQSGEIQSEAYWIQQAKLTS